MSDITELCRKYFAQQAELGMPSYIFSRQTASVLQPSPFMPVAPGSMHQKAPVAAREETPSHAAGGAPDEVRVGSEKDTTSAGPAPAPEKPVSPVQIPGKKPPGAVRAELVAYYKSVAQCQNCPLGKTRRKFVFGAGNAEADIMVIGEAPGADEDQQGIPFVGRAGQLLTKMLAAIGLSREDDVFITNILKCRPPQNRNPESSEILTCLPILNRQIEIIGPKALLLLGRISAHTLLNSTASISALRGNVHSYKNVPAMVTYHPAALLRQEQYKRLAWEDLQKFQALLRELNIYAG